MAGPGFVTVFNTLARQGLVNGEGGSIKSQLKWTGGSEFETAVGSYKADFGHSVYSF